MLVCIDKITCARMLERIEPRWQAKLAHVNALLTQKQGALAVATDGDAQERLSRDVDALRGQARWMGSAIIEIVISEAQNEIRDFARWGFDIIPHRVVMKTGFETPDGKRVPVDDAFKDPQHPFRVAIVCAMWLTGFDVECLATLYIDKPMRAHNLMQAIARANRVFPGKDFGVIVDYNGMLKSLRQALAQYALGDDEAGDGAVLVVPIEELVVALVEALEAAENHLLGLGFDARRLDDATGFGRIECLRDAVDALCSSDEAKRRFEIMARQVLIRFTALLMEPSARAYAVRRDNIEAIYKKLDDKRDTADVTELLKELHRIVNEAIRAAAPGADHAEGLTVDLSQIDFVRLRDEFASKVRRKHAALQDIREVIEKKLAQMLARNPMRMDYYKKYQEIIADYNREKDRTTVEATFAQLVALAASLDAEQRRAAEEGLSDEELALFDLLSKGSISKTDRERLKQASKSLLVALRELLRPIQDWTQKTATQAQVEVCILDNLFVALPRPPFTDSEIEETASRIYDYVWQRSASGQDLAA
jgi:Type I site-specific restriction-modification system, R (restriction) subunit and related helicases